MSVISNLSLANTFGQWVIKTNDLVNTVNNLYESNFTKTGGTLFLSETGTSLNSAGAILTKSLEVLSTGSVTIHSSATVEGTLTLSNTTHLVISSSGSANIGNVAITGPNHSLSVSNSAVIYGVLTSNVVTANVITVSTLNNNYVNSAFGHANAAFNAANSSTSATSAFDRANAAFARANSTLFSATANSGQVTANSSSGNIVFGLATTAVSSGTYGGSTNIPVVTFDSFGRATYAANVSVTTGLTLANDNSTDSTQYPIFSVTAGSGSAVTTAYTSSANYTYNPSSGTLTVTNLNSSSDVTLKSNIVKLTNAVDTVQKLDGVSFNWNKTGAKSFGIIAQDVEKVLPEIVSTDSNGIKAVNYQAMTAFLIESIKELKAEIETLKQQIK